MTQEHRDQDLALSAQALCFVVSLGAETLCRYPLSPMCKQLYLRCSRM
jgi:hypothetical protein